MPNGSTMALLSVGITTLRTSTLVVESTIDASPKTANGQAIQCFNTLDGTAGTATGEENTGRTVYQTIYWTESFSNVAPGSHTVTATCKVFGATTGDDYNIAAVNSLMVRAVG